MADLCATTNTQPQGVNQSCLPDMKRVEAILLMSDSQTFTNTTVVSRTAWENKVKQDLTIYMAKLDGYTPQGGEVQTQTTQFGRTLVTGETPGGGDFFIKSSPCDYRELLQTVDGSTYKVVFILRDGSFMMWQQDGTYYGFSADVIAPAPTIPASDNLTEFYKLSTYFKEVDEFRNMVVVKPNFNPLTVLWAAMPNGLSLVLNTHDNDDPVVIVRERCQDGVTGLTYDDFEIVAQSGSRAFQNTGFSDDGAGVYTLDLDTALAAAGDYVSFRVKNTTGSDVDDVSGIITLEYQA